LYVCGSSPALGNWSPNAALKMRWRNGHEWQIQTVLTEPETQKDIEYKYIIKDATSTTWEGGPNRVLNLPNVLKSNKSKLKSFTSVFIKVEDDWTSPTQQKCSVVAIPNIKGTAFVVLGKRLLPNGGPAPTLINRMEVACKAFLSQGNKEGDVMILTGGRVQTGDNVSSEAEVMKELAIKNGVEESKIILEDEAKNTIENVLNTREIMEEIGHMDKVVIITSDYHMERSKKIFEFVFGKDFKIECIEDTPPISASERQTEEHVEKYMLSVLNQHLKDYRA